MRDVAIHLAQSSTPHRCIDILELAHQVGCTSKHGAYEAVTFHLALAQNWELVLIVVSTYIQHIGKPTVRLLNWRARALMELQQYGLLQDVLEDFDAAGLTPTYRTYYFVLTGCLRNYDLEGAKHCIRRINEAGFALEDKILTLIGSFHRHFGVDLEVRRNALDNLPNLSPKMAVVVLNNIIQSSLDMQDVPTAFKLLSLFDRSSVQDIVTVLTSTFARPADIFPSELQLPVLPCGGLQPDTETFVIFMNHQIRCSNYQRTITLGEIALEKGLPSNANITTALVHAFFLQDRGNIAIGMIARLSKKSMPAEFATLMARTAPVVCPESVPVFSGVPLTTRICNALLRGILRRQGLRNVDAIFAIMRANDLHPNARTLELLVSYLSDSECVRPRTVLKVMKELSTTPFELTVRHMHHFFRYILREEKRTYFGSGWRAYEKRNRIAQRKRNVLRRSLSSGDPFDPLAGLGFGSHSGYSVAADSVVQSLIASKAKSDPAMISMRIRRDALLHGEFESAHSVFRTLTARGIRPNHYHFSALMEGYAMMGDVGLAKDVMKLARDTGVAPNAVMYTILIHGYGRKHDSDAAMRTFQEMVEQDIYPDVASIDAVVGALFASGARKLAREQLVMLWPYIEPFPETLQNASLATLINHFRSLDLSRSKVKKTTKSRASIYHQVRRLMSAYVRYFVPSDHNGSR